MPGIIYAQTGTLDLAAAVGEGKKPTLSIQAYNGGKLRVGSFYNPVVVKLSGLKAQATIPILIDHVSTVENTLGQGTPTISAKGITIKGEVLHRCFGGEIPIHPRRRKR